MLSWDSNFFGFVNDLEKSFTTELPGLDAQFNAMPPGRERPDFGKIEKSNPKQAGVLALFYPHAERPHIALMKRNAYPGVHSGQISLPGGQKEAHDTSLIDTALRETHEEFGVHRNLIEVKGLLTRVYIPPSNFLVQPVVGTAKERPSFIPDRTEVDFILEVPFEEFLRAENFKNTFVNARGIRVQVPAYHVKNEVIWGATAMMIAELHAMFLQNMLNHDGIK